MYPMARETLDDYKKSKGEKDMLYGKFTKPLAAMLLLLLIVSMMAGCTQSTTSVAPTTVPTTKANTAATTTKPEPPMAIKFLARSQPFEDGTWGQKWLEEKFNLKITIVRIDNQKWAEQLSLLFATGDTPDVFPANNLDEIASHVKKDVLAVIPQGLIAKTMPGYAAIMSKFDPNLVKYASVNGMQYGLPIINAMSEYNIPLAMRGDWLKNVNNSKIPVTLQDFEDVFVKFVNNDPNQNGKKDTYALSMPSNAGIDFWFQSFFGAYGTNPARWMNRDGKLVYGFTETATKDCLKLLRKWYTMGLIDPEFITDIARTNNNDDLLYKFAIGRIGFIDHVWYDDYQWDNGGNVNFKWVANSPEWKKFFEDNKNDLPKLYGTKNFTEVPTSGPQPVYVNIKPPVGPNGNQGTLYTGGTAGYYWVFGKQTEKNPKIIEKWLSICEQLVTNYDLYFEAKSGPEGQKWIYNSATKTRVINTDFAKSPMNDPQGRKLGDCLTTIMDKANPAFMINDYVKGNEISGAQRFNLCAKEITSGWKGISNALKVALPSTAKFPDLSTMIREYIVKAILGEKDIDVTFDDTVQKWKANGGDVLTKEANDWYATVK